MQLDIQYKIKNNHNLFKYLKENSSWYKYLNRNKNYLKKFEDEMKERYKLTTKDRIEKIGNGINQVSKIMDILK